MCVDKCIYIYTNNRTYKYICDLFVDQHTAKHYSIYINWCDNNTVRLVLIHLDTRHRNRKDCAGRIDMGDLHSQLAIKGHRGLSPPALWCLALWYLALWCRVAELCTAKPEHRRRARACQVPDNLLTSPVVTQWENTHLNPQDLKCHDILRVSVSRQFFEDTCTAMSRRMWLFCRRDLFRPEQ